MQKNIFKYFSIVFLLAMFVFTQNSFAQLTGVKTVGGGGTPDYATLALAIADLNTQGVGSGGVTFNVAAGHTETFLSETAGTITATGTLADQIIFQRSGAGANPLITAFQWVAATAFDGMIKIAGGDYITFDGIDLQENSLNTTIYTDWGYALVKASATTPFNGCQFVTIRNSTITLNKVNTNSVGIYVANHIATATTSLTITDPSDANNNNKFFGNTITNCYSAISLNGFNHTVSPFGLYDQNNEIGVTAANTITNFGGGTVSARAIYGIYQNGLKVVNNSITSNVNGSTTTVYGIFLSTGTSSNVDVTGNTISLAFTTGTYTSTIYGISSAMGSTAASNTVNINNNTVQNCDFSAVTTGAFLAIQNTSSAATVNVNNNTVSGNILAGTGTFTGLDGGAPVNLNMNTNSVFGNQKTGASGSMFLTRGSTAIVTYSSNNVYNNSIPSSSGTSSSIIYGYYNLGSPTVENIFNNNIYNLSVGGTNTSTSTLINGMYSFTIAAAVKNIYSNTVRDLSVNIGSVAGIRNNAGTTVSIYKNNIYNLSSAGTASATVEGLQLSTTTNTYAYNNFISDLKAPNVSLDNAVRGISYISTTAGNTLFAFYNTIFLNATSIGANFGASGIWVSSASPNADFRNNIVVNNSTANGTGFVVAHRRGSSTLTTYLSAANNNNFFAGTPSATNLIFYDGTNSDQTIAAYKARVAPRDGSSFTENSPFVNVSTTPYNLHMNTGLATQTESGGIPVSTPIAIADDFDGNTRNATTPDVGADEFAGVGLDLSAPVISYTALGPTNSTSNRTLVVTVTDAGSGVPTTAPGWPNLYWMKTGDVVWTAVQPTSAVGSAYTYNFGAGVTVGDVVSYYVVAQDLAGTPNIGAFPSAGAGGFTANPPAAATPPTTPSSYQIVGAPLAGDYTVGTALFNSITGKNITFERSVRSVMKEVDVLVPQVEQTYEKGKEPNEVKTEASDKMQSVKQMMQVEEVVWTPMENGMPYTGDLYVKKSENPGLSFPEGIEGIYLTITAAVNDLNLRGVGGATSFLLTDATYTTETFPITVNIIAAGLPTAANTVTIRPNTGVVASVSGAGASTALFIVRNSYVTINGSNSGGTDRSLTLENTSPTSPSVMRILSSGTTPLTNVAVRNCNLINGASTSSSVVIYDVGAAAGGYFNNLTIQNNRFSKGYFALYSWAATAAGNGSGTLITGNDMNGTGADALLGFGVYVQGFDGATVSNNNIANITQTGFTHFPTGIWFATDTRNSTISGNTISNLSYTGTSAYAPRGIAVSSSVLAANVEISGNTVSGITTSGTTTTQGIYAFGTLTEGVNILRNRISNVKNTNTGGYSAIGLALGTTSTTANFRAANNFIWDVAGYGWTSTTTDNGYGINILSGGGYNLYHNSVHLATNQTTLTGNPAALIISSSVTTAASLDIRDNIFSITSANGANRYAVLSNAANTVFSNINYNDYYTTGPNLGYIGAANQVDLAAWQTSTAQDVNSISGDPEFLSLTDLHIQTTSNFVSNKGVFIASVPTDIDGDTRSVTTPDIGADEYTYAPPAVLDPTGVTATAISSSQIDVAFTPNLANNNVIIVWNTTGSFTVPAGTPPVVGQPFAGGTLLYNGLTSPQSHTGLTQVTTYYYRLFSYNGSLYSPGENALASTPCSDLTALSENFDAVTPPAFPTCWFKVGTGGSASTQTTNNFSAPNCLYMFSSSTSSLAVVSFPPLSNAGAGTHQLKFKARANFTVGGVIHVGYLTIPGDASSFVQVDSVVIGALTYQDYLVTLGTAPGANKVLAFRHSGSPANSVLIDNVVWEVLPATPLFSIAPLSKNFGTLLAGNTSAPQDFTITNTGVGTLSITAGGITLTGTDANQFTLGSITYPIDLTTGQSVVVAVTFAPTTAGSKTANLQIVHNTTGSPAIVPLSGSALPGGILFEDFSGTIFPPANWLAINNDGGTKTWYRSTLSFNSSPASAGSDYESGTIQNNDWLITPRLSIVTGDSLTFWHTIRSASFPESMVIKIGATNNPNGTWIDIDSIFDNTTIWKYKSYNLSAYNGQNMYVAFVNRGLDQFTVYVDDVVGPALFVASNDIGVVALSDGPTTESIVSSGADRSFGEKIKSSPFENEKQNLSVSVKVSDKNGINDAAPLNFEVIVQNFGNSVENSYQVGWRIDGVAQASISNTEPLEVGDIDTLTLTWSVPVAGSHTTKAWTILGTDTNPANDSSATISFYVAPANAVFVENFEGTFPPAGWLTINADGGGTTGPWFAGNPSVFPAYVGNGYAGANYQGANGLYIDEYLITPNTGGLAAEDVDSLTFYMRSPDGSIWPDSVQILVSTTGTNPQDFTTLLAYVQVPITGWTRFAYALPNSATRYIAFRYLIYDAVTNSNYIGLDLVQIQRHATTPTTFQVSVAVNNGWNMVSIPGLHPVNQDVTTWWSGKDPAAGVFRFSGGYLPVTAAVPGTGYWMKHVGANTYNTGDEWPAGGIEIVANTPFSGATGWNLIGGFHLNVLTSGITTTPSGLQSGSVFGYASGYVAATNLVPGYGYWIKLTAPGLINIPTALVSGPAKIVETNTDDWGKIIITDNSGKSYTLYTVNGEVNLNNFELPPLPPAGMFDVRYSSDRYAEELSAANQTIELSGMEYPVTVRVENASIKLLDETGKTVNARMKSGEEVVINSNLINKLLVSANIIPDVYALEQNYPNPFNPSTVIEFSIPEDAVNVKLTIYDALGQRVTELVNTKLEAGNYRYQWDARNVASGLYIYELRTEKFSSVKKMMLMK